MPDFSIFARCFVLGALCLALMVNSLSAQNEIFCGVTDLSKPDYQAILDGVGPMPSGAGSLSFNLPIWFNVVREATPGYLGYPGWESEFIPMQMLNELNGYFSSTGIQFYLCGISQIYNDDLVELTIGPEINALTTQAKIQNPNYNNVINVFLVTKIQSGNQTWGGFNGSPAGGGVGAIYTKHTGSQGARTIAHELGHYFTLPHTFSGGPIADPQQPWLAQYVNASVTLDINGIATTKTCHETGDGFCDTRADPTIPNVSACTWNSTCQEVIGCSPFPNDPLGVPYNPDGTLLMGYSFGCGNRFSGEQAQQMKEILMAHPAWSFLTDNDVPTCQNYTSSDRGYLMRNCVGIGSSEQLSPFKEFLVPFEDANSQQCGSPIASTNIDGRYLTFSCVYPYLGSGMMSILPEVDHPTALEGVTTYDLVLISKHILGILPFENPFQIIAGDVNNSGSVTSFDIVELRKLILGIYPNKLPNNSNWRFVPEYCFSDIDFVNEFYDPTSINGINPFNAKWTNPDEPAAIPPATNERTYLGGPIPNADSWMDHVTINPNGLASQSPQAWSFWGLKVGDVNCSAVIDGLISDEPDDVFTTIPHTLLSANQIFTIDVKALCNTPISAWQLGIDFAEDSLQILEVQPGNSTEVFSLENFGITQLEEGKFRALNFSTASTGNNVCGKTLFKIKARALKPISNIGQRFRLTSSVLPEKFYSVTGEEVGDLSLQLQVSNGLGMQPGGGIANLYNGVQENTYNISVYPVPFSSEIIFNFNMPKDDSIQLSVFDIFGHLVMEQNEVMLKGPQSFTISTLAEQPVGLYWYSFESGGQTQFGKIIKN